MFNAIRLYIRIIQYNIKEELEYGVNAAIGFINQFAVLFFEFLAMVALFDKFGSVKGWTFQEVFLSYGIVNISFSMAETFMRGFETRLITLVRTGEFDRYLLRPRSTILQVSAFNFQFVRLGRVLQASAVLAIGLYLNMGSIFGVEWVVLVFTIIGGCCLYFALYIVTGILTFKLLQPLEFMSIFIQGSTSTMQYPMTIFPRWIQQLFTYVLPVACVSYFPIAVILDKPVSISENVAYALPLICYAVFVATIVLFHIAEKTYVSSGS